MREPHILIQDNNGNFYLIPEDSQIGFLDPPAVEGWPLYHYPVLQSE